MIGSNLLIFGGSNSIMMLSSATRLTCTTTYGSDIIACLFAETNGRIAAYGRPKLEVGRAAMFPTQTGINMDGNLQLTIVPLTLPVKPFGYFETLRPQ